VLERDGVTAPLNFPNTESKQASCIFEQCTWNVCRGPDFEKIYGGRWVQQYAVSMIGQDLEPGSRVVGCELFFPVSSLTTGG